MNAEVNEVSENVAELKPKKAKTEVEVVTMEDGRKVEFAGKRKLVKDYVLQSGNLEYIILDFRNGVSRKIVIPQSLLGQFAGHGAIQKYGDELAGLKDADGVSEPSIDDMILTIDVLDETIQQGKWSTRKEGEGMGGTSILIKALMEYSGKTVEQIKAYLKDKDAKFKAALRADDLRPNASGVTLATVVKRLESEKLSKGVKVDTSKALDDLDSIGEVAVA